MRFALVFGLLWSLGTSSVCAQKAPEHVTAPFWLAAKNPNLRHADTLARQGRVHLYPALGLSALLGGDGVIHRRASIENAIARFERAHELAPEDAEITYLSARALSLWERKTPGGRAERKSAEAIERFLELRRTHPEHRAHEVAFELGLLYSRLFDLRRSAEEYERALAVRVDEGSLVVTLSNLAEVTMMQGDLERAVSLYERAADEGVGEDRLIALFGLAVALDRLGEGSEAMVRARTAIKEDQRPLAALRQNSVFFVPAYEGYYFEAIGLLAQAEEIAGKRSVLNDAAERLESSLLKEISAGSLLSLKQVLGGLREDDSGVDVERLASSVERAFEKARAKKGAKTPEEVGLDPPEIKAVVTLLASLRAFTRYLNAGGKSGPFADSARAHVQEISDSLHLKYTAKD